MNIQTTTSSIVIRALLVTVAFTFLASPALAQDAARDDSHMQWWRDARYGMFIHWGLYSDSPTANGY